MSDFEKLLGELDALQTANANVPDLLKAAPAAAAAGAAEGDEGKAEGDDAGAGDGDDDKNIAANGDAAGADAGAEGDDDMTKSFRILDADGNEIDGIDGTEMLKALAGRVDATDSMLSKAFGGLMTLVKSQSEAITALVAKVDTLGGQGRGRKTVVAIVDKPDLSKALENGNDDDKGMSPGEFMAKALEAQKGGKITGQDVAMAEGYLNRGMEVPPRLVARVLR